MSSSSPNQVALDFIQHINGHSPDALAQLMTADHCFIDSTGRRFEGREQMRGGRASYCLTCQVRGIALGAGGPTDWAYRHWRP